jgi:ABC-2 type transport system permease protein
MTRTPRPELQLSRENGLWTNAWLIAKREFVEKVYSRIFAVSTILLASLAVVVALTPVLLKVADRGTTTTIAVIGDDTQVVQNAIGVIGGLLNADVPAGQVPPYTFVPASTSTPVNEFIANGQYAGALVIDRDPERKLTFKLLTGERMGPDSVQKVQFGAFAVGILDFVARNGTNGSPLPAWETSAIGGAGATAKPIEPSEYAGRRIVGLVFLVLIFITLVIYGMWVAAGVVAEKSSRVMELLISSASPSELVLGKVVGIGIAGVLQYVAILVPALLTMVFQDRIAIALLGTASGLDVSLATLTPGLLAAYGAFWVMGFILYALIYAAAGSLVSRAEDLQVLALPLSLIAIGGYVQAIMALSGGIGSLVRISSFVPFWSPFVMLTRLTIGTVEPWELVLSFGLLAASIPVVAYVAVRVYSAGVLLYGQRPGLKAIAGAIVSPPA